MLWFRITWNKKRRPSTGRLLSVLLIKHAFIPVCPQQQARHPIGCLSHDIADLLHVCFLRDFDDEFIMDVPDDEAIPEILHGEA